MNQFQGLVRVFQVVVCVVTVATGFGVDIKTTLIQTNTKARAAASLSQKRVIHSPVDLAYSSFEQFSRTSTGDE